MKTLSLKLKEDIFQEIETLLQQVPKSRNAYISDAIEHYNRLQKRKLLEKQLEEECRLVAADDYAVLLEMEALEDELED